MGFIAVIICGVMNFPALTTKAATVNVPDATGVGNTDDWTANTGTKANAVASSDGDTTYISSSVGSPSAQTFSFPGTGVPGGSTINSVTLTAQVKKGASFFSPQIQLRAQNASSTANDSLGHIISNDSSYTPIVWEMTSNPFTSAAWTLSEVNAWTIQFGVAKTDLGLFGETAMVTEISLTVDYTEHPAPATNPSLPVPTCGLDIALVLDNSGSIGNNLPTMKTSFNNFVISLLPGTPTEFSVTYFDGTAEYALQTFSSSASTITTAITAVPSPSGQTNWEDGLLKAYETFDPRPGADHPNLIIFASDGVPNLYNEYDSEGNITGTQGSGGSSTDPDALDAAVAQANIIKNAGIRIITLGIGGGVDQGNMEDISSADAYYSAGDFDELPEALDGIAGDLCGSSITATKIIDQDGNLGTTGDQSAGIAWNFTVAGASKTTDSQGKTASDGVNAGTYTVVETSQTNFSLISASCTGATNNGSVSGTTISGIEVNGDDIVSCVFYNQPTEGDTSADVSIVKTVNNTTVNAGSTLIFTLVVKNNGPDAATGVVASDTLPSLLTFVSATSTVGSFNASTSLWTIGNLASGASATSTITATVNFGTGGQTINNAAMVAATSADPNLSNNSSSASSAVNNPNGSFVLTVTKTGNGNGTMSAVVGEGTPTTVCALDECRSNNEKQSFTETYASGTVVTLTANPDASSNFNSSWSGACGGTNPVCAITITGNMSVNAHFALNPTTPPPCTSNCGGGGGGGGGTASFIPSSLLPPAPQVLGITTPGLTAPPVPQVLGATTLPRTGVDLGFMSLVILTGLAIVDRKFRLV